jgi:ammonia channel protein AmtB
MADYFTAAVSKNGVQAIGVFSDRSVGNSNFIRCAFLYRKKKTMGLRVTKEEEIDGLDIRTREPIVTMIKYNFSGTH